jgi:hypothetical protein
VRRLLTVKKLPASPALSYPKEDLPPPDAPAIQVTITLRNIIYLQKHRAISTTNKFEANTKNVAVINL